MKKTLKLVVAGLFFCLSISTTVTAQNSFKKSDKIIEGTASYSKESGSDATYSVNPSIGYFLTDRAAVGILGGFGKDGGDEATQIGAFARYYMLDIGKNLKVYSQLTVGNTSIKTAGVKTSTFGIDGGLGINYFVSSKFALSLSVADLLSYSSQGSESSFSIGWNGVVNPLNSPNFGILFKF